MKISISSEISDQKPKDEEITHILSVDVEDYFMVEAFSDSIQRSSWEGFPSRVEANTHRILDLLDQYGTRGTFFFLGWVAARFPKLVREVGERGHELACHSYWHRPVYKLSKQEFREDTRNARDAIEQASGLGVYGYRAPTWTITENSLWALDILIEEGFTYDSSIYPIRHDLYGIPGASRFPYAYRAESGRQLIEFPPATIRFAGINLPAAGGGYLRILPFWYTERVFRKFEKEYKRPLVVYLHPWEVDQEQPHIHAKLSSRLRHYTHIERMQPRLETLLKRHAFRPFQSWIAEMQESQDRQTSLSANEIVLLKTTYPATQGTSA